MPLFFRNRATDIEIMDDLSLGGEVLTGALDDLARVARWLGGTQIVRSGMKHILRSLDYDHTQPLRVADLGCGGGEALRDLAQWAQKAGIELQLTGIDANAAAIDYARKASHEFSQITFLQENIVEDDCRFGEYDVIMCSLVLHHFDEETHLRMIRRMKESGVKAILINDLQRSALAWSLFQVVSRIFSFSHMARYDGLLSIRKSFTRQELVDLMKNSGIQTYSLSWKWAFRYQLIALIS
ncbi:MAG: methyltransferase domain-containing protein [Bacteroidia bacterium]|nr:methyltransferase domain-containing protein [Bacteroidia bacterium]